MTPERSFLKVLNWLQQQIKDLTAQPGGGNQASLSLAQLDPKYLLDFFVSAGFSSSLVALNSNFQNPSGFVRIFFFILCPMESFYWYVKPFTSVANIYKHTWPAKTNFQELSHHLACLSRLDENLWVGTHNQRLRRVHIPVAESRGT